MGQCRLKSLSRRARQCPSSVTSTPSIWSTRCGESDGGVEQLWGSTPAGRGGVVQSPFSAWPDRQQCEAELWRQYQELRSRNIVPVCLPDTVDPRGPKGK